MFYSGIFILYLWMFRSILHPSLNVLCGVIQNWDSFQSIISNFCVIIWYKKGPFPIHQLSSICWKSFVGFFVDLFLNFPEKVYFYILKPNTTILISISSISPSSLFFSKLILSILGPLHVIWICVNYVNCYNKTCWDSDWKCVSYVY